MEKNNVLIENTTTDELKKMFKDAVREVMTEMNPKSELYLTRSEVAGRLRVTLPTIDKLIKSGKLKAYRLGNRILFKERELELTTYKRFER